METPFVQVRDLGLIDYKEAWDLQESLLKKSVDLKVLNRTNETNYLPENHLLFCEHPHVYTLGKSGKPEHLLLNEKQLVDASALYYKINRGGDITYHGPGQLVMYPILDLEQFFTDIHKYLRYLEEVVILTLAHFGIVADRYEGLTGVWIDPNTEMARKICAMGVKCSRWITMHGIGFNVNSDLSYFSNIIPCGIDDKAVTSMEKELGKKIPMDEVKHELRKQMEVVFGFKSIKE
ncbi:MAG: lipoyl(octanoyl) transferase LipB [Crocinitomicaceae bacterium]|jgi:lipoyl(octanoyl) transferase|nr:lipoyl(octanoyl) transferase LipB [Crocinitomicaceae bacterium]